MLQESVPGPPVGDQRSLVPNTQYPPYSGVAHLKCCRKYQNGQIVSSRGTGSLVKLDDSYFILTAAHCLYDNTTRCLVDEVHITLGRDGNLSPYGTIVKASRYIRVPERYKKGEDGYDYGLILLDINTDPIQENMCFVLREVHNLSRKEVYISGYPGIPEDRQANVPGWPPCTQWSIQLTQISETDTELHYPDATTPGMSGSPIYTIDGSQYVVIGIHTNGFQSNGPMLNRGVRMSEAVITHIQQLIKSTWWEYIKNWIGSIIQQVWCFIADRAMPQYKQYLSG